jgi:predicted metalloprotease
MRWQGGRQSSNIDDRRGSPSRGGGISFGGRGPKLPLSVGGAVIAVVLLLLGVSPSQVVSLFTGGPMPVEQSGPPTPAPANDEMARFVSVVLADTEDTFTRLFQAQQRTYNPPTLVLFTNEVQSACGSQSSAVGPFYCPGDSDVYIDLGFFDELHRMGAPGDFAQAYVIAHEVGHHLQNELGTSRQVHSQRARASETEANELSVRQELQADCYAGVWGHFARNSANIQLEPGDLEEGLRAANEIGDDTLQREAGRRVQPDSFTHGTSEQRVRWFRTGFDSGSLAACDTFSAATL